MGISQTFTQFAVYSSVKSFSVNKKKKIYHNTQLYLAYMLTPAHNVDLMEFVV